MLTPGLVMIGWSTLVELGSTSEVRGTDSMLLNNRLEYLSKLWLNILAERSYAFRVI